MCTTPEAPEVPAAVDAISEADWVTLGPGSWYTSVIPHLLVPRLTGVCHDRRAPRFVFNLASPARNRSPEHCATRWRRQPSNFDVIVADPTACDGHFDDLIAAEELGARVLLCQVRTGDGVPALRPASLRKAACDASDGFLGEVGQAETWLL